MSEVDNKKIAEIAERYQLALVVLFGSRARQDAHGKSDFDLAYSSIQPLDFSEENRMATEFHSVFRTTKVDLVNINRAGPLLLKKIVDEGQPLYEAKPSLFQALYLYAMRIYRESGNLNQLRRDYVLRRVEQFKQDVVRAR